MKAADFWFARTPLSAAGSWAVSPNDDADLVNPVTGRAELALALRVTGAGDVCFVGADGGTVTWPCGDLDLIPVPMKRVKATGTTATGLIAVG